MSVAAIEAPSVVNGKDLHGRTSDFSDPVADAPDAAPTFLVGTSLPSELDEAFDRATSDLRIWRRSPLPQRAAVLRKAANELASVVDVLAPLIVRETGKPIVQARREVNRAASTLSHLASEIEVERNQAVMGYSSRVWGLELREPRGVAAILNSWNMPLQLGALKVGAALAAGCSAVLKPSPLAPVSSWWLCQAFLRAGLPPGCFAVVQGERQTGRALVADPRVKVVSLTGADGTGREVMALAAPRSSIGCAGGCTSSTPSSSYPSAPSTHLGGPEVAMGEAKRRVVERFLTLRQRDGTLPLIYHCAV